jgi:hypothetical protein
MSERDSEAKLVMQVTTARDDGPDLFDLLANIRDAKRRSNRLKELAKLGLLVERGEVSLGAQPRPRQLTATPSMSLSPGPTEEPQRGMATEMLNWGEPEGNGA